MPELCPHLCGIADRKTPYMRAGLIISLLLLLLTSSLFAQHIHGVLVVDTVAGSTPGDFELNGWHYAYGGGSSPTHLSVSPQTLHRISHCRPDSLNGYGQNGDQ